MWANVSVFEKNLKPSAAKQLDTFSVHCRPAFCSIICSIIQISFVLFVKQEIIKKVIYGIFTVMTTVVDKLIIIFLRVSVITSKTSRRIKHKLGLVLLWTALYTHVVFTVFIQWILHVYSAWWLKIWMYNSKYQMSSHLKKLFLAAKQPRNSTNVLL